MSKYEEKCSRRRHLYVPLKSSWKIDVINSTLQYIGWNEISHFLCSLRQNIWPFYSRFSLLDRIFSSIDGWPIFLAGLKRQYHEKIPRFCQNATIFTLMLIYSVKTAKEAKVRAVSLTTDVFLLEIFSL